jgi:hypothetical protein
MYVCMYAQVSWNKQDPHLVATILTNSSRAIVIDTRMPSVPLAELAGHQAALNGISWYIQIQSLLSYYPIIILSFYTPPPPPPPPTTTTTTLMS